MCVCVCLSLRYAYMRDKPCEHYSPHHILSWYLPKSPKNIYSHYRSEYTLQIFKTSKIYTYAHASKFSHVPKLNSLHSYTPTRVLQSLPINYEIIIKKIDSYLQ